MRCVEMGLKSLLTTSSLDTSGPRSEGCYGWIIPLGFNIHVPYLWLSDWDSPERCSAIFVLPVSSHTTMLNGALNTW